MTAHDHAGHVPAPHTPLDSLLYLDARTSVLDWISEELGGVHSDEPDLDLVVRLLDSFGSHIRDEVRTHGGWRSHYSTGHPVFVEREARRVEPDSDGGPDRIEWVPFVHVCTPGGVVQGVDDEPT